MIIVAIKDVKVGAFRAPFIQDNEAVALRNFKVLMSQTDDKHIRDDLELWQVGEYEFSTGITKVENKFLKGGFEVV